MKILELIFKKCQIDKIDTAMNGLEGFKILTNKKYDLVVCDLNMPTMDGYQFCEETIKYY